MSKDTPVFRRVWQVGRAQLARSTRRRSSAAVRRGAVALLSVVGSACYTYRPVTAPAPSGLYVSVQLNDHGRLELANSLGGAAERVEGMVQATTDSSLTLRVSQVQFLNGQVSRWTNEPITIRNGQYQDVRERQVSRKRSILTIAGAVGAVMAFVVTRSLVGSGHDGREPTPPPPTGS